ncbi:hypothetical protein BsWGS_25829 [Bradybaena similaris]
MASRYRLSDYLLAPVILFAPVILGALLITGINGEETEPKQKVKRCGADNPNNNVIDLRDPVRPGPFHDLTKTELRKLRTFLERHPDIRVSTSEPPEVNSSYIHSADLLVPPKAEVLNYLDTPGAPQPIRKARVVVVRGDKDPAVVEEYVCWPLPDLQECTLLNLKSRRNPVEYAFRPLSDADNAALDKFVFPEVDRRVGYILQESYGATFTSCEDKRDCLITLTSMVGTALIQESKRLTWYSAAYNVPYYSVHALDFAILADTTSPDASQWSVVKLWYGNDLYDSFDSLIDSYNSGKINKTRTTRPVVDENLFSSLKRRGEFQPPNPQRPPTLVEPDGKRYSVKDRQVKYLDWTFNFRQSSLTGPAVYDVRFKGQRIAYEVALSEIAVFYSGHAAYGQSTNYVDSGVLLGSNSRSLVPGGDCPETATLIHSAFVSQTKRQPDVYKASMCLFEHNNGYPLRRHLAYSFEEGSFYGGMMDYVLTLRSALTIDNYDYIIDFIFHHNGVVEARLMSTGYILSLFYTTPERPYGYNIHDHILGNVHHHLAHFKVDLDVGGTCNRYETLDISEETVPMTAFPERQYSQARFKANLKRTELEAVHDFDFNKPKYHVVHNAAETTDRNEIKGYRIQMNGASKNLVAPDFGNEKTISWARHQMVVTRHKDDEVSSSSIYGMHDSLRPAVDFTTFYKDNETIVDKDLVFWITSGLHHIPHTEDLPVTPTVGNHLTFFLLPYNYFPECPSMGSRDAIYVEHKDPLHPELGVKVDRNGNSRDQCVTPRSTLEEDLEQNPNQILES